MTHFLSAAIFLRKTSIESTLKTRCTSPYSPKSWPLLLKLITAETAVIFPSLVRVSLRNINAYLLLSAHINDLQILGNSTLEESRWREILNSIPPRQRRGLVPGRNSALLQQLAEYTGFR